MLHKNRRWCVTPVASAEELAEKLTEMTWCGCTGFRLGDYLWLNDATSADGAQEFAVLREHGPDGHPVQIESVTFSWCDYHRALEFIRHTLAGKDDENSFRSRVDPVLETPEQHGRCGHCA